MDVLEPLTIALAPFAPHIAEELWSLLGHADSITTAPWPQWQAEHLVEDSFHEDRRMALKILELQADELGRELLSRELYHLTRLVHPNLVKVFDFGLEPGTGRCHFTMEPVEGADLLSATQ